MLTEIALRFQENDIARAEVIKAVDFADDIRASLQEAGRRASWQARVAGLYDLARRVAIRCEDTTLLFHLVERSRARAQLDMISSGVQQVPESARVLEDSLEALRERQEALAKLDESVHTYGVTFVDTELVRKVARVVTDVQFVVSTSGGSNIVSPTLLENAIQEANRSTARLEERITAEATVSPKLKSAVSSMSPNWANCSKSTASRLAWCWSSTSPRGTRSIA
jgi:hypothetical protein